MNTKYHIRNTIYRSRGVTLIDTIVGTALMLVVFLGVAAAFQLSVDVVTSNKARAGAIALLNERMEYVRSLSYTALGTSGGIPTGALAQNESIALNGVTYNRRTLIQYYDDTKDGSSGGDTNGIIADSKTVKVEVSWNSRTGERRIIAAARIAPTVGLESAVAGGTLTINAVNSVGTPVTGASVTIVNSGTGVNLTTYTNASGTVSFIGTPAGSGYEITVTKAGYTTARTYSASAQNTSPNPGHLTVTNNLTTSGTFEIDLVSSMTVTSYLHASDSWSDSFADGSKIGAGTLNMEASGNKARFAGSQPWTAPGDLFSITITPSALSRWGTFSWNETTPAETTITYHVYYPTEGAPALVPDTYLPGNSTGYSGMTSIDISTIPAGLYPSLILHAHLVALNPSAPSPSIEDWEVSYESGQSSPLTFTLRGAKTIGSGPSGAVYKYDQSHTTNAAGTITITGLEWDLYTISFADASAYDTYSACLPQPVSLAPDSSVTINLFATPNTAHSLLVDVKNSSGAIISGALVRVTKGGSYEKSLISDACGQSFYEGLTNGNYNIDITASGYANFDVNGVNVTGDTRYSAQLE